MMGRRMRMGRRRYVAGRSVIENFATKAAVPAQDAKWGQDLRAACGKKVVGLS